MNIPTKIIVHHSASDRYKTNAKDIDQWHKERGFTQSRKGFFIGYHYVIFYDGSILQSRYDDEVGCHTIGQNSQSIGICIVGNFDKDVPTLAQTIALNDVIILIRSQHKISISQILTHRKFSMTHCYGLRLADDWAQQIVLQHELSRIKKVLLWLQIQISKISK